MGPFTFIIFLSFVFGIAEMPSWYLQCLQNRSTYIQCLIDDHEMQHTIFKFGISADLPTYPDGFHSSFLKFHTSLQKVFMLHTSAQQKDAGGTKSIG